MPELKPILIIPGFMSSGLEIKQSKVKPGWKGERIWINLQSLGFSSIYLGKASKTYTVKNDDDDDDDDDDEDDDDDDEDEDMKQQRHYKSAWINHMILKDDMKTERNGVHVQAISGLEGVDYLTPGALTDHVSYVFGPVINALADQGGYTKEKNLQAAPYDWRLPPTHLEQRDQYFTRTMEQIENLYNENNQQPVILLCHSLGTKTCHYLLNFCLQKKNQQWIDKYIHTYLPVGAPHIGAPKALRSMITGDKMGLDAFLGEEEALALGRSLGSGPWLFPGKLPEGVPSSVYVLPEGVLEIQPIGQIDTSKLLNERADISKPKRYRLAIALGGSERVVMSPYSHKFKSDEMGDDRVSFETVKYYFPTHFNPMQRLQRTKSILRQKSETENPQFIQISLQEPGIGDAKLQKSEEDNSCWNSPCCCFLRCITCLWLCELINFLIYLVTCGILQGLYTGLLLSADLIKTSFGGSTTLAISDPIALGDPIWNGNGREVTIEIPLYHYDDYSNHKKYVQENGCANGNHGCCYYCCCCCCFSCCCSCNEASAPRVATAKFKVIWRPFNKDKSFKHICSQITETTDDKTEFTIESKNKMVPYQEFSGYDIMEREGLKSILQVIKDEYDNDVPIGPRSISSNDAPPVKRVHAIYGINLPTEVGGIYKQKDTCVSKKRLLNIHKLDTKAYIDKSNNTSGYQVKNGLLYETSKSKQSVANNRQVSGDGTVPYWSLHHVHTWKDKCDEVSVVEIDKAEHREILADSRFHEKLIEYCKKSMED